MSNWYAIQCNPQGERKAAGELRRAGVRVYLPKLARIHRNRRSGVETVKHRPLLIGYLFIRFPDAMRDNRGVPQFGAIRKCQGVRDFVTTTNSEGERQPFPVPDRFIADFMRRQRKREFGRPNILDPKVRMAELRQRFKKGMDVRITDGPFMSFLAVLERLNNHETASVSVNLFGRATQITLGVTEIAPIAKSSLAA